MNISRVHNCYGCGICAIACGQKIIDISLNDDGFYEPHIIDECRCTNCGICTEVCAYLHEDLSLKESEIRSTLHGVKIISLDVNVHLVVSDLK